MKGLDHIGTQMGLLISGFVVLLAAGAGIASVIAYKPWGVHDLQREEYDEIVANLHKRNAIIAESRPISVVENTFRDSTIRQPGDTVHFHFTVTNEGDQTLELLADDASSEAKIVADKDAIELQPGESQRIDFQWTISMDAPGGEAKMDYVLRSNDPLEKEPKLTCIVSVASPFGIDGELKARSVETGETARAEVVLYSQRFDDFSVLEVDAPPPVQITYEPVQDDALLQRLSAKSAIRLIAEHPTKERIKKFSQECRVRVGTDPNDETWFDMQFQGRFLPRIGFYGPQLDVQEGLVLGVVELGSDQQWSFVARFRGENVPSGAFISDVKPDGLSATVTPVPGRPSDYRVTIKLDANAKPVDFQSASHGYVVVASQDDHKVSNWLPLSGALINPVPR